jgi:hypothetical protein
MDRRLVEIAEAARESEEAWIVQPLAPESQNEVLMPGRLDRLECGDSERLHQVHARNVGAQSSRGGDDGDAIAVGKIHDSLLLAMDAC